MGLDLHSGTLHLYHVNRLSADVQLIIILSGGSIYCDHWFHIVLPASINASGIQIPHSKTEEVRPICLPPTLPV